MVRPRGQCSAVEIEC